ncbi:MAG: EAL domain-containing protein [Thiothrix sp.]|nr:EAL domain-containing protein [Thiothrix sp.]HPQ95686.1 EAL domain-containing protein [Thiolinea sp.]
MGLRQFIRRRRISIKVLLGILMFSSLLTAGFTANQLYQDYRRDLALIDRAWDALQEYATPVLSRSLWLLDDALVRTLINSVARLPQTAYVAIHDTDGELLFSAGIAPGPGRQPERRVRLDFLDARTGRNHPLGELSLYANYDQVYRNLKSRFLITLYTQLFKTFLVSLFTLALVYVAISRHLVRIADFLSRSPALLSGPLTLKRNTANDELQLVVDTLNRYRHDIRAQVRLLEQEVDARRQAENTLALRNQLLNTLFHAVQRLTLVLDQDNRIVQVNRFAMDHIGLDEAQLLGMAVDDLVRLSRVAPNNTWQETCLSALTRHPGGARAYEGYCQFVVGGSLQDRFPMTLDVYPLIADGHYLGCAVVILDETSRQYMAEIAYHASHDYLTGTYNRYYFDRQLEKILSGGAASAVSEYVIGLLDLDGFKKINDLFGHAKGDETLIRVAQVLRSHLGPDPLIARQGGDEFVFVIPMSLEQACQCSTRMLRQLEETAFYAGEHTFHVSASIGLAALVPHADTVSSAISRAGQGCYHIKGVGGGNIEVVRDSEVAGTLEEHLREFRMVDICLQAIRQEGLLLFAQPIIPLQAAAEWPPRVEILVRLEHDGIIRMPADFIPALERGRIIHQLDQAIFELLARYIEQGWLNACRHINVNLSPFSLHNRSAQQAALHLLEVAHSHGIHVIFEVTENALISHFSRIQEVTRIIRQGGGHVAVDDFGKGLASYAYLEQLEIGMIKIDGSLVTRITESEKILAIIASIQSIASSIGAVTVAEHVAGEPARRLLQEINITYTQSFYDGRPYPLLPQRGRSPA